MSASSRPLVAVIDIGSNSIKILLARRRDDRSIEPVKTRTIDARISAGISRAEPRLTEEGMTRGMEAVIALLAEAAAFSPEHVILVATSAVRDALNGDDFRTRVRRATSHEIRILSGAEEANLIGRGLTCDPALAGSSNFYVFDLGGGSLECLAFRERQIEQAVSLQLGCVRLTERFVPDVSLPFAVASEAAIAQHTRAAVAASGFRFTLPAAAAAIATGGTAATVRAIRGARDAVVFEATDASIAVSEVRELLAALGGLPLDQRKGIAGLPPARADVFPTALATLLAVAEIGGFAAFLNSVYNLRYGLADETLP